mmetsp:Transcript_30618/g.60204  ORF Transcript_30618/g.60204 Transcript_30618/m.60204 type:complete len:205 (-) Transcript_30618:587-1201(-)
MLQSCAHCQMMDRDTHFDHQLVFFLLDFLLIIFAALQEGSALLSICSRKTAASSYDILLIPLFPSLSLSLSLSLPSLSLPLTLSFPSSHSRQSVKGRRKEQPPATLETTKTRMRARMHAGREKRHRIYQGSLCAVQKGGNPIKLNGRTRDSLNQFAKKKPLLSFSSDSKASNANSANGTRVRTKQDLKSETNSSPHEVHFQKGS